ncbi:MAG TPA: type I-U CRISPR-associated protein Csx17 [Leptolyngbyaceae cyanobacterium]
MTTQNTEVVRLAAFPEPLASYLKGVGILRIVSLQHSPIRGWWENGQFAISGISKEALSQFLLTQYRPTPIVSPWNGSTGFSSRDQASQKQLLSDFANAGDRFHTYSRTVRAAQRICSSQTSPPKGEAKVKLIQKLRNALPDEAIEWIDLAVPVVTDRDEGLTVEFNPLMRTGGNDGNFEFSRTYMQQLQVLFDLKTGQPTEAAELLLRAAIWGEVLPSLPYSGRIGMFSPLAGFNGQVNAWDSVLLMEGAIAFAPGISNRMQAAPEWDDPRFPFVVESAEEVGVSEFLAPLWRTPASYSELRTKFSDGRFVLQIGDKIRFAKTSTDVARAISR